MTDTPTVDSPKDSLSVRDNRTGREYEIAISDGTIRATDLKQIAVDGEPGLATYDPGFVNTASCRSAITYIDGDEGILRVPRLSDRAAGRAVDLPRGRLPADARRAADRRRSWTSGCTTSPTTRSSTRTCKQFMEGFRYDAHPMGMLMASVSALSTFYPEASDIGDPDNRASADRPDDRQDADPRRLRLPPRAGQAVRLPGQRAVLHRPTSCPCCSR